MRSRLVGASLLVLSMSFGEAMAVSTTFTGAGTGPGGVAVSASALFDITGNTLTITLSNTSVANNGADVPGSTLTGLFWNSVSNITLTPFSAVVASGSTILNPGMCSPSCAGVTNVSGEFGYAAASFTGGANRGIASSGYLTTGLSGNIGNFNNGSAGVNLAGPMSLDGINFGIVSAAAGFNPNGGLESVPLIQSAVVFMLTGVSGLTIADFKNVSFQYGTSITELNIPSGGGGTPPTSVPEPGTFLLFALSLVAVGATRRRRPG